MTMRKEEEKSRTKKKTVKDSESWRRRPEEKAPFDASPFGLKMLFVESWLSGPIGRRLIQSFKIEK